MHSAESARHGSLRKIADLGFPAPPGHLPVLASDDDPFVVRPEEEVVRRALVVNVRVNLALGMPPELARDWLIANDLTECLSPVEQAYVGGSGEADERDRGQVEALWALAWALGLTPELDHATYCGDELASLLPDLRTQESADAWSARVRTRLRASGEILEALDLLYVMTWGLADANLSGRPGPGVVEQYVLWERRRALEFVGGDGGPGHAGWDAIDLAT